MSRWMYDPLFGNPILLSKFCSKGPENEISDVQSEKLRWTRWDLCFMVPTCKFADTAAPGLMMLSVWNS